jgi:hypothetical protein
MIYLTVAKRSLVSFAFDALLVGEVLFLIFKVSLLYLVWLVTRVKVYSR